MSDETTERMNVDRGLHTKLQATVDEVGMTAFSARRSFDLSQETIREAHAILKNYHSVTSKLVNAVLVVGLLLLLTMLARNLLSLRQQ